MENPLMTHNNNGKWVSEWESASIGADIAAVTGSIMESLRGFDEGIGEAMLERIQGLSGLAQKGFNELVNTGNPISAGVAIVKTVVEGTLDSLKENYDLYREVVNNPTESIGQMLNVAAEDPRIFGNIFSKSTVTVAEGASWCSWAGFFYASSRLAAAVKAAEGVAAVKAAEGVAAVKAAEGVAAVKAR